MKIVFAEPIGLTDAQRSSFVDEMKGLGHTVKFFDGVPAGQEELCSRSADADVLVVSNYPVSKAVIETSGSLKMVAVAFTGVDHLPIELCRSKGVLVCNAAGYSTQAVAELAIALAIDLFREIVPFDRATRTQGTRNGFMGRELKGKTFGIIGFGAIGQRTAMLAQAFGCRVIAWSRTKKEVENVTFLSLEQLLVDSDIVSVHLPLTDKTRGLIDGSKLKVMKPGAVLINTARGPIVDSNALAAALKSGTLAGAALDVYEHEPPVEAGHPVFSATNTILLPHIGFATHEAIEDRSEIVLQNIRNWMRAAPTNVVL